MYIKKVSVCIPVFGTEQYLEQCLSSVKNQTFTDYEVIVVNDGSTGADSQGNCCKKIIKSIKKKYKLPINYIEHSENKGLLEARRTAIYAATGDYIFNLDSDDKLPPDALENLYNVAVETGADIVHGKGELFSAEDGLEKNKDQKIKKEKIKNITNVYIGKLEDGSILENFLIEKKHTGFIWGKLFKRQLYLEAFDKIPPIFCTVGEDYIQYLWITYLAKQYVGINKCVYFYCYNTGITANNIITDIKKWEQVCSVSSVFSAIFMSMENSSLELDTKKKEIIDLDCCKYLVNNLYQLNNFVAEKLHKKAYEILCDFWGKEFVIDMEKEIKDFSKKNNREHI